MWVIHRPGRFHIWILDHHHTFGQGFGLKRLDLTVAHNKASTEFRGDVRGQVCILLVGLEASLAALGYHDLRVLKEGVGSEQIAQVFD